MANLVVIVKQLHNVSSGQKADYRSRKLGVLEASTPELVERIVNALHGIPTAPDGSGTIEAEPGIRVMLDRGTIVLNLDQATTVAMAAKDLGVRLRIAS